MYTNRNIDPLAYLTAKTNGLQEEAAEILEAAGLDQGDIDVPCQVSSTLNPPSIMTHTENLNWPLISGGESFWDRALANGHLDAEGDVPYVNGVDSRGAAPLSVLDDWVKQEGTHDMADLEEGGWDLDADTGGIEHEEEEFEDAVDEEDTLGLGAAPGVSESEHWVRNSPFAVDHVAAGSFESAMQVPSYFPAFRCQVA